MTQFKESIAYEVMTNYINKCSHKSVCCDPEMIEKLYVNVQLQPHRAVIVWS